MHVSSRSQARVLSDTERAHIEVACLQRVLSVPLISVLSSLPNIKAKALNGPEDIELNERKRLNEGLRRRMRNPAGPLSIGIPKP